ncbi:MAG: diguanylate cyclase [Chitinispirillales bacterium]|jgi:diguanylate cyclase (GGDEF)-like protein|nr:diguanylate cyclase [Chitinispirillales bacterium]
MDITPKNSILIVDDEKTNLMALNHLLHEKYTVYTAKDGRTAIERVKEYLPDLVLLDVIMPEMNGYEILAEIRKLDGKIKEVPVIFITGLSDSENEEKGLLSGAADYIGKPFSSAIVKLRVHNQLQIVNQMRIIERLSQIDQLTGIPNRRSLDNQMFVEWGRAVRENIPIGFLMIDVDKFKTFNDTYGHQHGDVVLQTVAKILTHTLKRSGDFAARYGGEEFSVLLPNTDIDGVTDIAEQIRKAIEKESIPCKDGSITNVTISIGVHSLEPSQNDTIQSLIAKADEALYAAKNTGRNKVCRAEEILLET